MIRELLYGIFGVVLLAYAADFAFSFGDDPQEPPRLRPKVPVIGHLLGIIAGGPTYYSQTSKTTNAEIYMLGIFNYKVYVNNTSRLMPIILKQSKALSFRPFLQITAKKHGDATDETYELFGGKLVDDFSHCIKTTLSPGPFLDDMILRMGKRVLVDFDALLGASTAGSGQRIYLLEWVRHAVIQASSCGVYGEQHPWQDAEVEKAYWTWQKYLTAHLVAGLDVFGTGYAAREKVFNAYIKYCKELPSDGSQLAKEHQRVLREAGVCDLDNAKQASIFTIAAFPNSAPTLYWTLWELFSRPEILAEVREELIAQAVTKSEGGSFILDVASLKSKCPLLLSVLQETQRTRHVNASFRKVMTDTMLDGKYLLKAGNFLQMPGKPIHENTGLWGEAALKFDPYRFVPSKGDLHKEPLPASGFVAWGAAPYLCPARQFAATEILIVTALMAIRADLQPFSGVWERSPALNYSDLTTLLNPLKDVNMDVKVRKAWAGKWVLKFGESTSRVSLASG